MKNFKSHFKFNRQERSGIFFLLFLIVLLQIGYLVFCSFLEDTFVADFTVDKEVQIQIDDLKKKALQKSYKKKYPFNPNFISDYKGYVLGMSVDEIDRLHAFREVNSYVNSAKDFQNVTQVSDSLLRTMVPYFKFPEWSISQHNTKTIETTVSKIPIEKTSAVKNLNSATVFDLIAIRGIGEVLSKRIVKFRDRLGGFLVDEQLYDVYGLEAEVVQRVLQRYKVQNPPRVEKININIASVETLSKLIYLQRNVAISIVRHRNSQGSIKSFEELLKIENFPIEKIDRIVLYLSL